MCLAVFSTNGLIAGQPNLTIPDTFSSIEPNLTTPNTPPNLTTPNTVISNQEAEVTNPSSSITETVNEVLSGSIDGMIGETVDMLSSSSPNSNGISDKSSLNQEIPSSLTLGKNNQTINEIIPDETKLIGNTSNSTQNISNAMSTANQSTSDSVGQIKQSFQKSIYNSTIAQSFDNNSFTKLGDHNTFDNLIYKMKNILDTDLFK
jgi:hypothetical protein